MKDRLCKIGRTWVGALCLLATCGLTYSCSDDYDLPTTTPSWLGSSIYNYLEEQGSYKTFLGLIDDLGYKEVLSRTGSKTLFVANDSAFQNFFKPGGNPWNVTDAKHLSLAQKKLLMNSVLLNNAYLVEMMPNISTIKNECLRQTASVLNTDSIMFLKFNSGDIPYTEHDTVDYWSRFRTQEKGGIYLSLDATAPMLIHFIGSHMRNKGITDDDFSILVNGETRDSSDIYVYDSKVVQQDITCQNGYLNKVNRVVTPPSNMAEVVRQNKDTKVFSHILDRFSAPFYNKSLTNNYNKIMEDAGFGHATIDSIYEKRYFSNRSQGGKPLATDPNGNPFVYQTFLSYDPGWNQYYPDGTVSAEYDMAAMFVPEDKAFITYFLTGGGRFLLDAYVPNGITPSEENIISCLDYVPLSVLRDLINNMMKPSFIQSVPSKYRTIMNDARDPMFVSKAQNVEEFKSLIERTIVASNGVVYVMNYVPAPASYSAVYSPGIVSSDLKIFNWLITGDDNDMANPGNAPLNKFYSAYLKAMSANFSLFMPNDNALKRYYDPVSHAKTAKQPYIYTFTYDENSELNGSGSGRCPIRAQLFTYDPSTGEITNPTRPIAVPGILTTDRRKVVINRLLDMLESHIFIHDNSAGMNDGNAFYLSKDGSAVKIVKDGDRILGVKGGWQLQKNTVANVVKTYDKTAASNDNYGNGMTYVIDKPIQSTMKSVYGVMTNDESESNPYLQFYELCQVPDTTIENAGFLDNIPKEKRAAALNTYRVFTSNTNSQDGGNVQFFSTFNYTVYIPTNTSVKTAVSAGLPTWTAINQEINKGKQHVLELINQGKYEEATKAEAEYKKNAKVDITFLLNFVRYHFQDQSVYVDKRVVDGDFGSASVGDDGLYQTIKVHAENNAMTLTDKEGNTSTVDGTLRNVMARDIQLDKPREATLINTSSFAVVHQISGVLCFVNKGGKTYAEFIASKKANTVSAKAFIDGYRIRK